jgi:hypothetical protein
MSSPGKPGRTPDLTVVVDGAELADVETLRSLDGGAEVRIEAA